MAEPTRESAPPARRRSSFAYDPARDTFKELPDTHVEGAIAEDPEGESKAEAAIISSPTTVKEAREQPRKRRRSVSFDGKAEDKDLDKRNKEFSVENTVPKQVSDQTRKRRRTDSLEGRVNDHGRDMKASPKPARGSASPLERESKPSSNGHHAEKPKARIPADLPRIPRKPREDGEVSASRRGPDVYSRRPEAGERRRQDRRDAPTLRRSRSPPRKRSRSPPPRRRSPVDSYRRRSPPRERRRSPSPIRDSPPREAIRRPGGASGRGRNVLAEQQRLAAERERNQAPTQALANRGVQALSNQFYNERPEWVKEKGRDWRKNESKIKGLRSFNNWVKSTLIHKFSPEEKEEEEELGWGEEAKPPPEQKPLLILDIGCGKGGDLGKWQQAPQQVGLFVGLDPAEKSIEQARERYGEMRRGRRPIFDARFYPQDCFGAWIGDVEIVREVGIDPNAGSAQPSRWGGGGFDIVSCMFAMHYSFEAEEKVRMMLRNVAGSLKKGGRFIGTVPNSDVCAEHVQKWFKSKEAKKTEANGNADGEEKENGEAEEEGLSWGNSIYKVTFPNDPIRPLQADGSFRPPFSWKYTYWMDEAVDVPEFVVPWEAFRALAEQFNLEQRYRKPFLDIYNQEQGNRELMQLAKRMGVVNHEGGDLRLSEEEKEAVSFYHAFCFVKV